MESVLESHMTCASRWNSRSSKSETIEINRFGGRYVDSDNLAELQYSVSQPVDNRPSADSTYNRHSQGSAHGGDGGGGGASRPRPSLFRLFYIFVFSSSLFVLSSSEGETGSARRQSTLERLVAATSRTLRRRDPPVFRPDST